MKTLRSYLLLAVALFLATSLASCTPSPDDSSRRPSPSPDTAEPEPDATEPDTAEPDTAEPEPDAAEPEPMCQSDPDCELGLSCCEGQCVDLHTDGDHCGACGNNACPAQCQSGLCLDGVECVPEVCLQAVQVDAGYEHTCAVLNNGTVRCWGRSYEGQAGFRGHGPDAIPLWKPVEIEGIDDAVQVGAGYFHSCALHADGGVSCWGDNRFLQLALPDSTLATSTPQRIEGLSDVVYLEVANFLTCAVLASGEVKCWGINSQYRMPRDWRTPTEDNPLPSLVPGISNVKMVALGESNGFWLHNDGVISVLGGSTYGVGLGTNADAFEFTPIEDFRATFVATSTTHTCAIDLDAQLWCWGENFHFQVGPFTCGACFSPMLVPGTGRVTSVATTLGFHITTLTNEAGQLLIFGRGTASNLGQEFESIRDNPGYPRVLIGIPQNEFMIFDTTSSYHSCGLSRRGQVYCGGSNGLGRLGHPGPSGISLPVEW